MQHIYEHKAYTIYPDDTSVITLIRSAVDNHSWLSIHEDANGELWTEIVSSSSAKDMLRNGVEVDFIDD